MTANHQVRHIERKNTDDEDLVYLVSGQRIEFDVCDFPRGEAPLLLGSEQRLLALDGEPID